LIEFGRQIVHFEIPAGEPADNPPPRAGAVVGLDLRVPAVAFALPTDADREIRLDAKKPWPVELRRGVRIRIALLGTTVNAIVLARGGKVKSQPDQPARWRLTLRGRATQ
jgi:hypothetical protein